MAGLDRQVIFAAQAVVNGVDGECAAGDHQAVLAGDAVVVVPADGQRAIAGEDEVAFAEKRGVRLVVVRVVQGIRLSIGEVIVGVIGQDDHGRLGVHDVKGGARRTAEIHARQDQGDGGLVVSVNADLAVGQGAADLVSAGRGNGGLAAGDGHAVSSGGNCVAVQDDGDRRGAIPGQVFQIGMDLAVLGDGLRDRGDWRAGRGKRRGCLFRNASYALGVAGYRCRLDGADRTGDQGDAQQAGHQKNKRSFHGRSPLDVTLPLNRFARGVRLRDILEKPGE